MIVSSITVGSSEASTIVPVAERSISSFPEEALASSKACRSEPGPASARSETVKTAANMLAPDADSKTAAAKQVKEVLIRQALP
jgi:hypothetical protein